MGIGSPKEIPFRFFFFSPHFFGKKSWESECAEKPNSSGFWAIQLHTNSVNYILETRSRSNSLHLRNGCVQKEQSVEILEVVLTLEVLHYIVKLIVVKWLAIFAAFLLQFYFAE